MNGPRNASIAVDTKVHTEYKRYTRNKTTTTNNEITIVEIILSLLQKELV